MTMPDIVGEDAAGLKRVSLGREDIAGLKRHFTNDAPYWPRISFAICTRLLLFEECRAIADYVRDEIEALEGLRHQGNTKPAKPFRKPPLRGLWHKHFSTPEHTFRNIGERWGLSVEGNRDLDKMIQEVAAKHGDQPDVWPGVIAHRVMIEGLLDRSSARRMTGDWIIFAKNSAGANVYLDVASHEEGKNPELLLKKLAEGCACEFPELFHRSAV